LQAHATRLPHFSSRYIADIQCISDTEIDALIDEVKYMVHTQGLEDANL